MLRRVRQTARCHQILFPGFVGGGSQRCITHNEVAKGWTSTFHRQDKHDFSLIVIEFQLVSTHQDGNDRCHIYQGCESNREDLRKSFNGTIIYRTLLDNLLEFKKEECVLVAIKFDIEITTVVKLRKKMQSDINPVTFRPSQKKQTRKEKHASWLKQTGNSKLQTVAPNELERLTLMELQGVCLCM